MSEDLSVAAYEADMWAQVEVLAAKRAEIDRLEAELERLQTEILPMKPAAGDAVRRYGAALSIAEQPVPEGTIRKLYWGNRDVPADAIAKAFGLGGAGVVHRFAGDADFEVECPGRCGRGVQLTARTVKVKRCTECEAAWEADLVRSSEEHAQRLEARRAKFGSWAEQQLALGRSAADLYVESLSEPDERLLRLRELERKIWHMRQVDEI
ncbi:MAG TPA: hypothetical protein VFU07_05645 [Candidatus Lumbricidophila sp.]|nr:hypothetical protein [Candidatus Lumbricidophila sp.]